jgi:hypothetical protein
LQNRKAGENEVSGISERIDKIFLTSNRRVDINDPVDEHQQYTIEFLKGRHDVAVASALLKITRLRATPKTIAAKTTAAKLASAKAPVMFHDQLGEDTFVNGITQRNTVRDTTCSDEGAGEVVDDKRRISAIASIAQATHYLGDEVLQRYSRA